jgi:hypothetical protein
VGLYTVKSIIQKALLLLCLKLRYCEFRGLVRGKPFIVYTGTWMNVGQLLLGAPFGSERYLLPLAPSFAFPLFSLINAEIRDLNPRLSFPCVIGSESVTTSSAGVEPPCAFFPVIS